MLHNICVDQEDIEEVYDSGELNYPLFLERTRLIQQSNPVTFENFQPLPPREMSDLRRRSEQRRNEPRESLNLF